MKRNKDLRWLGFFRVVALEKLVFGPFFIWLQLTTFLPEMH